MSFSGLSRWRASVLSLSLLSLLLVGCAQNPRANEKPNSTTGAEKPGLLTRVFDSTKPITVSEGTDLTVVLEQSISTGSNRSGDTFKATLASPIVIDGLTVIPKDARVTGHIVDARASGRLEGVAKLDRRLDSVEVNGTTYDITTDDEGRNGKNHNKRNGVLIGGGAGAVIGGAVGAGAGTAGAAVTGKKDIRVPAETALTFHLVRPVTVPVKS